jgi:hypothetical protein
VLQVEVRNSSERVRDFYGFTQFFVSIARSRLDARRDFCGVADAKALTARTRFAAYGTA